MLAVCECVFLGVGGCVCMCVCERKWCVCVCLRVGACERVCESDV